MKNITISRTLRRWMEYVSETKNARSLVHRVVKTFKHKSMAIGFKNGYNIQWYREIMNPWKIENAI